MSELAAAKEAVKAKLSDSRRALLATIEPLSKEQWETIVNEDPEPWTVADLLRHLYQAERGMHSLCVNISQGGEGASADFNLARWNHGRVVKSRDLMPAEILLEMVKNRSKLLRFVDHVDADGWDRIGLHGSLREMSVGEILHLIADHERVHAQEIARKTHGAS